MFQNDFQIFCKSNDLFLPKKRVIKYSLFIFIFHICAKFYTPKKKKKQKKKELFFHLNTFFWESVKIGYRCRLVSQIIMKRKTWKSPYLNIGFLEVAKT
jgi:hypothetical protein